MKFSKKLPKPAVPPDRKKKQSAGKNEFRLFNLPRSPYFHMRVMVEGKRRQFSTGETSIRAAQAKARVILADIKSRGFNDAVTLHARKENVIGSNPTIAELGECYMSSLHTLDKAPTQETARYYVSKLQKIGILSGAIRISDLTPEAIQKAKAAYVRSATKKKRDPESITTTLASMIRNAAAVFSRQSLEAFRQQGLNITNPFATTKVRGVKVRSYTPMSRDLVTAIWDNARLLRDGDPEAPPPDISNKSTTDFRLPQEEVFALLILELGLGLRRNEADKARWDWLFQGSDERRYLEVRETQDFRPKSRQSRVIPVADEVWDSLKSLQNRDPVFIVPGPPPSPTALTASRSYRCDKAHRALVFWLQKAGVSDAKPCHALRKEFGSYVATCFSLFHAQKLLGHSTPAVTSAYYASLTDLPHLDPSRMGQTNSHLNNPEKRRRIGKTTGNAE